MRVRVVPERAGGWSSGMLQRVRELLARLDGQEDVVAVARRATRAARGSGRSCARRAGCRASSAIVSPGFTTSVGPTKFSSYARPSTSAARDVDAAIARDEIELQHAVLGLHARRFGERLARLCRE